MCRMTVAMFDVLVVVIENDAHYVDLECLNRFEILSRANTSTQIQDFWISLDSAASMGIYAC